MRKYIWDTYTWSRSSLKAIVGVQPFVSIHAPYIMGVYTCIDKEDMYVSMARMCRKLEAGTHVLVTMYVDIHASERVHPLELQGKSTYILTHQ